ncbi:MAG: helicase RepA family protein [Chloroflexota bacterium]|nr:helicase RepA family protein [Chloroflexota bacterium]
MDTSEANGPDTFNIPISGDTDATRAVAVRLMTTMGKQGATAGEIERVAVFAFPDLDAPTLTENADRVYRVYAKQAERTSAIASRSFSESDSDPVEAVLERLESVKQATPGNWRAWCPVASHSDGTARKRSLSVTRADDGRVLLTCHSRGCSAGEIMTAIDMNMSDLFPRESRSGSVASIIESARRITTPEDDAAEEAFFTAFMAEPVNTPKDDARFLLSDGATVNNVQFELPIYSGAQVLAMTDAAVDWVAEPFLVRGATTGIIGKVKSAGKTTWVGYLLRSIARGEPFFDKPTAQSRVLYVTEQSSGSFLNSDRAGLLQEPNVFILFGGDLHKIHWPDLIVQIATDCKRADIGVVVFDTLTKLTKVKDENDNAGMAAAMEPITSLLVHGLKLAVLVAMHSGKDDSRDLYDSGRGASQIIGDLDIVLRLKRPAGNQSPTRRILQVGGRYTYGEEVELGCELTIDRGYVLIGEGAAMTNANALRVLANLPEYGRTLSQLQEDHPDISRTAFQRAIEESTAKKSVYSTGNGSKADPKVYFTA